MEVVQLPMSFCVNEKYPMRKNLPKTLDLLIFSIDLINSSLKNISQTVKNIFFSFLLKLSKYILNSLTFSNVFNIEASSCLRHSNH
jgi:hypothetical protein